MCVITDDVIDELNPYILYISRHVLTSTTINKKFNLNKGENMRLLFPYFGSSVQKCNSFVTYITHIRRAELSRGQESRVRFQYFGEVICSWLMTRSKLIRQSMCFCLKQISFIVSLMIQIFDKSICWVFTLTKNLLNIQ